MTIKLPIAAGLAACTMLVPGPPAGAGPVGLSAARSATARYHDVAVALAAGHGVFPDAAGITCIDNPGVGAMGVHYANGARFADPTIVATAPEVLVYEPAADGRLRLVALEYVVLADAWDALHDSPPELFGREFALTPAGNRYGLPAFYELHAWLWKHNPRGMFDDWNSRVSCPGP